MKKKIVLSTLIVVILGFVIINPKIYIQSVLNALLLFTTKYLPGAFIFFFFTKVLSSLDFQQIIGNVFKRPFLYLYNTSAPSGFIFTMSLLCGYPMGCKLSSDFYKQNIISKNEAITCSILSSISGPIFTIGTIGALFFENKLYGYILFLSQIFATLINALFYKAPLYENHFNSIKKEKFSLSQIMLDTILSLFIICGFICISYLISDILINLKVIDFLQNIIPINKELTKGIFLSLLEVLRGSEVLSKVNMDIKIVLPICAGLISFSGLSIILQSIAFLSNANIPVSKFILSKITQAILSGFICYILLLIWIC